MRLYKRRGTEYKDRELFPDIGRLDSGSGQCLLFVDYSNAVVEHSVEPTPIRMSDIVKFLKGLFKNCIARNKPCYDFDSPRRKIIKYGRYGVACYERLASCRRDFGCHARNTRNRIDIRTYGQIVLPCSYTSPEPIAAEYLGAFYCACKRLDELFKVGEDFSLIIFEFHCVQNFRIPRGIFLKIMPSLLSF